MAAMLSMMIFGGAFAAAVGVIAATIAPYTARIAAVIGGPVQPFAPLAVLAHAERRIAVRRWASLPVPAPIQRLRAAA